jgi:hypothetical protein
MDLMFQVQIAIESGINANFGVTYDVLQSKIFRPSV